MNEDKLVFVSSRVLTQDRFFLEAFPTDVIEHCKFCEYQPNGLVDCHLLIGFWFLRSPMHVFLVEKLIGRRME